MFEELPDDTVATIASRDLRVIRVRQNSRRLCGEFLVVRLPSKGRDGSGVGNFPSPGQSSTVALRGFIRDALWSSSEGPSLCPLGSMGAGLGPRTSNFSDILFDFGRSAVLESLLHGLPTNTALNW
jgi:hypothetical protein